MINMKIIYFHICLYQVYVTRNFDAIHYAFQLHKSVCNMVGSDIFMLINILLFIACALFVVRKVFSLIRENFWWYCTWTTVAVKQLPYIKSYINIINYFTVFIAFVQENTFAAKWKPSCLWNNVNYVTDKKDLCD